MELDAEQIQDAVVESISSKILDETNLSKLAREHIKEKVDKLFAARVEPNIDAAIASIIDAGFDRQFCPVDSFGRRTGDPTTIRKVLEKKANEYWRQTVDNKGRPSSDYHDRMTMAEYTMAKICGEDFRKHVHQEAVNTTARLKDGLREEMRAWLDRSLGDLFRVRSDQDKKEGRHC